jgi:peptide/nickel transport system substrate-binding protein
MSKDLKKMTRRQFMELTAAGAAGAAVFSMGIPDVFAATPKRGGKVTCGMAFLIQSPDPTRYNGAWARQHTALVYDGLTTPISVNKRNQIIKEKGPDAVHEVEPMLADSWDIEKDGTRYVFHLKKGVKFHNGKELDSGDVKWTWEHIKNPVHRSSMRKLVAGYLESVETPDKYTVVANLSRPYAAMLVANAWCNCPIIPKDIMPEGVIWGETPTFKPPQPAPPGTGPFMVTEYQQKHQVVFKAFKDYRVQGLPYIDEIVYKVISKDTPRTMALRSGDVDFAYGVEPNYLGEVLKGKKDWVNQLVRDEKAGLNFFPALNGTTLTIWLNSHPEKGNSPFKDERVRQALDYCIDREKLAQALYGQFGVPMGQGFHPSISSWGFSDIKPRKTDIEKAKKLLKEAGYPDGLDVEFKITPTWGKNDLMAQVVQQMAGQAGFRIKITPQVGLQYWGNLRNMKYHMLVFTLSKEDPMNFYYQYLHTEPAKPYNGFAPSTGVKDPELDKLLDDMAGEIDLNKRKKKFKKVVQHCNDKAYLIPYMMNIGSSGWADRIKNFKPLDYYIPVMAFRDAWVDA